MENFVFIGGTGRCGTNITRKILDRHSQIATFHFETRIVHDPDGIIDFYNTYPEIWSPYLAAKKIKRLEEFLLDLSKVSPLHKVIGVFLKVLNKGGIKISPKRYNDWELSKYVPGFEEYLKELISELCQFSYPALWCGTESYQLSPRFYYAGPKTKEELAPILRKFLEKVIKSYLRKTGKKVFAEDTTWNILFAPEILELLPGAKILHVYRDPRDVVASLSQQKWSPNNPKEAVIYYKDIMERWFSIKQRIPQESYYEFKLENLVKSPEETMKKVCHFINLPYESSMIDIDLTKGHIGRWRKDFSKEEKKIVTNKLKDIITELGYPTYG